MKKSFIKSFTVLFSGSFLTLIIGLLTTPIITRIVNPIQYGQLSFFNMYSNLLILVTMLGLDQAFVKYFFEYKENERKKLLYDCVKISILTCALILIIISVFTHNKVDRIIMLLFIFHTLALVINRFSMLLIRMQQKTKVYSFLTVISKLLYVIIVIGFIISTNINHYVILVLGITLSNLIVTLISMIIENEWWNIRKNIKINTDIKIKELISYGYPYIFTFAITWVFQSADKIVIKHFSTFEEVGIYAGAASMISLITIIQTTFNTLWIPIAFEHYNKTPNDKDFYSKVNSIITIVMFLLVITIILFKDIFVLFLGNQYREASYIIPFLIFNPLMYTISETTVHGINFLGKTKAHILIAIVSCTFNIIGNIVLVPLFGSKGAAISTGVSYIVFFVLRTTISRKYYEVNYNLNKFYIITGLTVIYAYINTFFDIKILNITMYSIITISILILYNSYIKDGIKYILKQIKICRSTIK